MADDSMRLTQEQLEAILDIASTNLAHLGCMYTSGMLTDQDVKTVNDELARKNIIGPVVVIDIPNIHGLHPGNLASTLNGYGNYLGSIDEEIQKGRTVLEEIRDTFRSFSDANILAQPLPPIGDDAQLGAAADRILDLLDRRPKLLAAVKDKLNER